MKTRDSEWGIQFAPRQIVHLQKTATEIIRVFPPRFPAFSARELHRQNYFEIIFGIVAESIDAMTIIVYDCSCWE